MMNEQIAKPEHAEKRGFKLRHLLPGIMPKRLFLRTLIIVAAPLVLLQSILVFVSMERHWQLVTNRLSEATARDIAVLVALQENQINKTSGDKLLQKSAQKLGFTIAYLPDGALPSQHRQVMFDILAPVLGEQVEKHIEYPFWIDAASAVKEVEIRIKLPKMILSLKTSRNRAYASNTHIFLVWMLGSSIILLLIAIIFLRNQIRPILQLAEAADRFGKGQPPPEKFHPHGALEIRQAANAFLRMRDRIERHVEQRTTLLAGVSHDLRTILTRFKLELALMEDSPEIAAMRKDVDEMQNMINAYMDFAKGEGDEETHIISIDGLLADISHEMARISKPVTLHSKTSGLVISVRRTAFKRAITNLVSNAARHGDTIEITTERDPNQLLIHVDDNGPGISAEFREEVFQPFFRLEDARTQFEGSNTGLGLSIARDIIHSHGGQIDLADAPIGGLRATIKIPL